MSRAPPTSSPILTKNDAILTRAVASNDTVTAVVTALQQVKHCNRAAINCLFPGTSGPWDAVATTEGRLTQQKLRRACHLLSLAQRYLSVVDELTPSELLPPPGTVERLCAAWPTVVTQSHLGIVAFHCGRIRLALGYVESAVLTAIRALVSSSSVVSCVSPNVSRIEMSRGAAVDVASSFSPSPSPAPRSPSPFASNSKPRPASAASPSMKPTAVVATTAISQLAPAATQMTRVMGGSTECASQLVVLLLNYARILACLQRYELARECAATARAMLRDMQEVNFARATHLLAAAAQDQSNDWPSLLNGRTTMPLLQSLCAFTAGDVELLARPADPDSLRASVQLLQEADAAAAASDLPAHSPFRTLIFQRCAVAAEQLQVVNLVMIAPSSSSNDKNNNRHSLENRVRRSNSQPGSVRRSVSSSSPAPRVPSCMKTVAVDSNRNHNALVCGSPVKLLQLRGVLQTFREDPSAANAKSTRRSASPFLSPPPPQKSVINYI